MRTFLTLLALVIVPSIALGAESADAFIPLTNLPGIQEISTSESLPTFFNNLYRLCIGAATVIAILQIMRAGSKFMFNKGSVAQNTEAKHLIMNSILGLLLVLSPAIIFGIINKDILNLSLDLSGLELGDPDQINVASSTPPRSCTTAYNPISAANPGQQCRTSAGAQEIPATCCPGMVEGGMCCGRPVTLDEDPATEEEPYVFNYVTEERDYDTDDGKCSIQDPPRTFETLEQCRALLETTRTQRDCGTTKCQAAAEHNCNASRTPQGVPSAAEYNRISDMPSCN